MNSGSLEKRKFTANTIVNCFSKAGFREARDTTDDAQEEFENNFTDLSTLIQTEMGLDSNGYSSIDETLTTEDFDFSISKCVEDFVANSDEQFDIEEISDEQQAP
ncbi:hypothetical protein JTB14_004084 [Gonioctena quinquepunctata]|nr:hypothetical protein JTB14_004084 [Gonioctena quinquepunctata]